MADSLSCHLVIQCGAEDSLEAEQPPICSFMVVMDGSALAEEEIWLLSRGTDAPLFRAGWEGWGFHQKRKLY
ncbi:hypothetical protein C5S31_02300 [ANME-1 cluster archaeon GoMg2]|nr:hypothetical protein [ANME-1 cluster archaeon GoMg2]